MKNLYMLLAVIGFTNFFALAQPQYDYNSTPTTANTIPFSSGSSNFRQYIYYPTDFPGAPTGVITTLYVKASATVTANFTNLTVRMGTTTLNNFTAGPYATGLTTVLSTTGTITNVSPNWMVFNLTTPYFYDNTKNLIIEFSQTGYSPGFSVMQVTAGVSQRSLYGSVTATSGSTQDRLALLGFDIIPFTCDPPANLAISSVGVNGANIDWDTAASAVDYEYVLDTVAGMPTAGVMTTDTFFNPDTLSANTQYYFYLRTNCGIITSNWIADSFMTAPCAPVNPVASNITHNSVTISWPATLGSTTFQYEVNQVATPPASGNFTALNLFNQTGSTESTPYFAHVRTICKTDTSAWSQTSFVTEKSTVGIGSVGDEKFDIRVFPNPVTQLLSISLSGTSSPSGTLTVYDLTGRIQHQINIEAMNSSIDVSNLSTGTYIVKYVGEKNERTLRISKQ